jgi:RimJ/RimL family protein N-acetyltransferase
MKPQRIARTDKSGNPFEIGMSCAEDFPAVLEMYRTFSPKPASQGLPPEDPEICQNWLKALFDIGVNVIAWRGDRVIGHVAVIPDVERKSGELVTFVDQNHRNLGIGTEQTRFALQKFGDLGFELVWLAVRVLNFVAVKLYKKLGFEFCDTDAYERVMIIELRPTGSLVIPGERP